MLKIQYTWDMRKLPTWDGLSVYRLRGGGYGLFRVDSGLEVKLTEAQMEALIDEYIDERSPGDEEVSKTGTDDPA